MCRTSFGDNWHFTSVKVNCDVCGSSITSSFKWKSYPADWEVPLVGMVVIPLCTLCLSSTSMNFICFPPVYVPPLFRRVVFVQPIFKNQRDHSAPASFVCFCFFVHTFYDVIRYRNRDWRSFCICHLFTSCSLTNFICESNNLSEAIS